MAAGPTAYAAGRRGADLDGGHRKLHAVYRRAALGPARAARAAVALHRRTSRTRSGGAFRRSRRQCGCCGIILRMVEELDAPDMAELRPHAAAHMRDLIAMAVGATRDGAEIARQNGVRAARLPASRRTSGRTSRRIFRSRRSRRATACRCATLQRLFEADGVTFTDFVLAERLARAHRMLRDARACRPADQHDRVRLRLPAHLLFQSRLPCALLRFAFGRAGAGAQA